MIGKCNSRKTKIVFFWVNAYSLFESNSSAQIGGIEVDIYNMSTFLVRKDFEVHIVTGIFERTNSFKKEGIVVHPVVRPWKNGILRGCFNAGKILYAFIKISPDICFFEWADYTVAIWRVYTMVFRRKLVYRTAHDWDCNGDYEGKHGIFWKLYKFWLLGSDLVITQNEDSKSLLIRNYDRISTVVKNFYEIGTKIKNLKNYTEREYFLWVGRCSTWKRPELFISIANNNPKRNFLMISPSEPLERDFFDSIKSATDGVNNIRFIEKVPFFKIQEYYDKAIAFVGTSDYEGFPNTYIQSLLGWAPIISLRVNPDQFLSRNWVGRCFEGNFSEMSSYIGNFSEKNLNGFQNNIREYIYQNHSSETQGVLFLSALNGLIKHSK